MWSLTSSSPPPLLLTAARPIPMKGGAPSVPHPSYGEAGRTLPSRALASRRPSCGVPASPRCSIPHWAWACRPTFTKALWALLAWLSHWLLAWTAVLCSVTQPMPTSSPPGSLLNATFRGVPHGSRLLLTAFLTPHSASLGSATPPDNAARSPRAFPVLPAATTWHPGSVSAQGIWLLGWSMSQCCTAPTK